MIVLSPALAEMAPGLMAIALSAATYGFVRYTKYVGARDRGR